MTTLVDILVEQTKEKEKYFENYLFYVRKIKKEAEALLGKVKIFVFGSILRKGETPQDIDILVISPKLKTAEEKSKIRAELWNKLGFSSPFEIHFATKEEYNSWWKYFLKKKIEI